MLPGYEAPLLRDVYTKRLPADLLNSLVDRIIDVCSAELMFKYIQYFPPDGYADEGGQLQAFLSSNQAEIMCSENLKIAVKRWTSMSPQDRLLIIDYFNTCFVETTGHSCTALKTLVFCKVFIEQLSVILLD